MTNQNLKYQLIADLLTALEAEEFAIGIGKHLELQELVAKLPEDTSVEELKTLLCPIFAKNKHDQAFFYQIFEQSWQRVKAVKYTPTSSPEPALQPPSNLWEIIAKTLGVIALLFLAWLLYLRWSGAEAVPLPPPFLHPIEVEKNDTVSVALESLYPSKDSTGSIFTSDADIHFVSFSDGQHFGKKEPFGQYRIDSTGLFTFEADSVLTAETPVEIVVEASYSFGVDTTIFLVSVVEPFLEPTTEIVAAEPVNFLEEKPIPYPKSLTALFATPTPQWIFFYEKNSWWLKPVLIFLYLALVGTFFKWYQERHQKIIADIQSKDKAPLLWNIEIPNAGKLELDANFYGALHQMRQRTGDEHFVLNVPKTIQQTIKNAGIIDFQYLQKTRPPEYLLLIDRQSSKNHRAHLFDFLYQSFKENEVFVDRFFFEGDVRLCWNEYFPNGIPLTDLQQTHRSCRLLIVSTGYQMLNPISGKLSKWTSIFSGWADRALLTPRPTKQWGGREDQLEKQFILLPASMQSLTAMVDKMQALDPDEVKSKITDAVENPIEFKGELIPTLQHYFSKNGDNSMLDWIAACAIYPSLHWDLTMYLGRELSTEENNLLTIENINQLTRLPWFVEGKIPEQARLELLEYLPEAKEKQIRERLSALFEGLPAPPENSVAFADARINIALNEFLLKKNNTSKAEVEKYLLAGAEADMTMIKYLEGERSPTDFELDKNWKKYAQGEQAKVIPTWASVTNLFIFIAFVIGLLWYQPGFDGCSGGESVMLGEQELCMHNPEDWLVYREHEIEEFLAVTLSSDSSAYTPVDSLAALGVEEYLEAKAIEMKVTNPAVVPTLIDTNVNYFYKNISIHFYNKGVPVFNETFDTTVLQDGSSTDTYCLLFRKAIDYDEKMVRVAWLRKALEPAIDNCVFREVLLQNSYVVLEGRVREGDTRDPIEGVRISTNFGATTSDEYGGFTLIPQTEFTDSEIKLNFSKENYNEKTITILKDELSLTFENQVWGGSVPDVFLEKKSPTNIPNLGNENTNTDVPLQTSDQNSDENSTQSPDQNPPVQESEEEIRLRDYISKGDILMKQSKWKEARRAYQAAQRIKNSPTIEKKLKEIESEIASESTTRPGLKIPKLVKDRMQDDRDYQYYQIAKMDDGKVWMTENLNYKMPDSYCYDNDPKNCEKYGRLYTWDAARNACPRGWRLPTDAEWKNLLEAYGGYYDGEKIEFVGDAEKAFQLLTTNTFSTLLGGSRGPSKGDFGELGVTGYYWSSTKSDQGGPFVFHFLVKPGRVDRQYYLKGSNYLSCRCVQDGASSNN